MPKPREYVACHYSGEELTVVSRENWDMCKTGNVHCRFWEGSGQHPNAPPGTGQGR